MVRVDLFADVLDHPAIAHIEIARGEEHIFIFVGVKGLDWPVNDPAVFRQTYNFDVVVRIEGAFDVIEAILAAGSRRDVRLGSVVVANNASRHGT